MKINARTQRVPTRFGREARFRLKPRLTPVADAHAAAFKELKSRLLSPTLGEIADPGFRRQLRLVANEATAIAWSTGYPLLVFPELFTEKTMEARAYTERQAQILEASPVLEVVETEGEAQVAGMTR